MIDISKETKKEERVPQECPFMNQLCRLKRCELYMVSTEKCAFYMLPLLMLEKSVENKQDTKKIKKIKNKT